MAPGAGRKRPRTESANEASEQDSSRPQKGTAAVKIEKDMVLEALTRNEPMEKIKSLDASLTYEKKLSEDLAEERSILRQVSKDSGEEITSQRTERAELGEQLKVARQEKTALEEKVKGLNGAVLKAYQTIENLRKQIEDGVRDGRHDPDTAITDYKDNVNRCLSCGWEVEDGRCKDHVRCGKAVAVSGKIDCTKGSLGTNSEGYDMEEENLSFVTDRDSDSTSVTDLPSESEPGTNSGSGRSETAEDSSEHEPVNHCRNNDSCRCTECGSDSDESDISEMDVAPKRQSIAERPRLTLNNLMKIASQQ